MKKILVTGGAGYIGSHTVKELNKEGFDVLVYDNLSSGHREAVLKPARLVAGDLLDIEKLEKVFKKYQPDSVMHFAASIEAGESVERPEEFFRNNVVTTLNLLKAMVKNKINYLVFSSSAAVYGEPKEVPIEEHFDLKPINCYGSTKMIAEEMFKHFEKAHGLKHVSLRYFNAAGADLDGELGPDHKKKTHLITRITMAANEEIPHLEIYGTDYDTEDGSCIRDYIHVTDLACAHILALKHLKKTNKSDVFNLGNEKGNSVLEVIKKAKKVTGKDFKIKYSKKRVGDPAKLVASSKKAKKALKWSPKHSDLETIIKTAWEWQKKLNQKKKYLPH